MSESDFKEKYYDLVDKYDDIYGYNDYYYVVYTTEGMTKMQFYVFEKFIDAYHLIHKSRKEKIYWCWYKVSINRHDIIVNFTD